MPRRRSYDKRMERREQAEAAENILNEHAFKDRENGDVVNRISDFTLIRELRIRFGAGKVRLPQEYRNLLIGEVRYDPRGTGSAQTPM